MRLLHLSRPCPTPTIIIQAAEQSRCLVVAALDLAHVERVLLPRLDASLVTATTLGAKGKKDSFIPPPLVDSTIDAGDSIDVQG